jgi:hypothetical protein
MSPTSSTASMGEADKLLADLPAVLDDADLDP